MSSYKFDNIKPFRSLDEGMYLVLLHANSVPPHLGLINSKRYYSLSVKGQAIGEDATALIKLINRKSIKTLFVRLQDEKVDLEFLKKIFSAKEQVTKEITCLYPIRIVLSELYEMKIAKAQYIYEVLPYLFFNDQIVEVTHKNMDDNICNGTFQFEKYTMETIQARVKSYESK